MLLLVPDRTYGKRTPFSEIFFFFFDNYSVLRIYPKKITNDCALYRKDKKI